MFFFFYIDILISHGCMSNKMLKDVPNFNMSTFETHIRNITKPSYTNVKYI